MTTVEYLKQLYKLENEVKSKNEIVEKLRSQAEKVTSSLNQSHVTSSHNNGSREDIIIKMIDMQEVIISDTNRLLDLRMTIIEQINRVRNTNYRLLLLNRYVNFKTWEWIAEDLGKTYQGIVYRGGIHDRAIKAFESVLKESEEN